MKKWKPLFQMLANLAVSSACTVPLLFLFVFVVRPGIKWRQFEPIGALAVFSLIFSRIENYHKNKNAQSRI